MKQDLEQAIADVVKDLFGQQVQVELTRPDEQFGDYATNVALQLANDINKNPREIAEQIAKKLQSVRSEIVKTDVAGPGFINIWLSDEALAKLAEERPRQSLAGQTAVAEYSDPNPFKVLHAGHLYTSIVGDAIAKLLETAGAKVYRVNFGGDVGLHVAKTMWAIIQKLGGENPEKLTEIPEDKRAEWMSEQYVTGSSAYGDDEKINAEIVELNKRVYQLHESGDRDSPFAQIYWTTREWSYDYFNQFYDRIGSRFDKYYPESETTRLGLNKAKELQEQGILEQSDGAVVFKGEEHGLHTRVFINSQGLPTYETKDLGLTLAKERDYQPDKSIIITANDIAEYMKVVLKVVEQFDPKHAQSTTHLTHGMVKLAGGAKMSSRKGNILQATQVLDAANEANQALNNQASSETTLAAVKYAFLKNRLGGDIIYDPKESVALEGNSGPYLQYAHARARSVLAKAEGAGGLDQTKLQPDERTLLRKIGEFGEVVDEAVAELMPHHICTYLYELCQIFNRFYENNRVIDDERQKLRLGLVQKYADSLKTGLNLLNISAPDKM